MSASQAGRRAVSDSIPAQPLQVAGRVERPRRSRGNVSGCDLGGGRVTRDLSRSVSVGLGVRRLAAGTFLRECRPGCRGRRNAAGQLFGGDVHHDQGSVLPRPVLRRGVQEGPRHIQQRICVAVRRRGVRFRRRVLRWDGRRAELVLGRGQRGDHQGCLVLRQPDPQVDHPVLPLGPGQSPFRLLPDPAAGGGAIAGNRSGQLGGGRGLGQLAQLRLVDQADHPGHFPHLGVGQVALAQGCGDGRHPAQRPGHPDVFAGGARGHGARPGQPVRRHGRCRADLAAHRLGLLTADRLDHRHDRASFQNPFRHRRNYGTPLTVQGEPDAASDTGTRYASVRHTWRHRSAAGQPRDAVRWTPRTVAQMAAMGASATRSPSARQQSR
jgi:hypothetical protein